MRYMLIVNKILYLQHRNVWLGLY